MVITKNDNKDLKPQNKKDDNLIQRNAYNAKKSVDNWPKWKKDLAKEVFMSLH